MPNGKEDLVKFYGKSIQEITSLAYRDFVSRASLKNYYNAGSVRISHTCQSEHLNTMQ